jgi:spoIIIJ-associated protein
VKFLTAVLKTMGVEPEVAGEENDGTILLNITSEAGGFIIGRKGETLEALSKIIEIHATRKKGSHVNVIVDTENYRARREEKLVDQAVTSAKKAAETGKKIRLAPMKTEERKTIHFTLQEDPNVETRSEGSDDNRRVVIFPARGNKAGR